MKKSISRRGFMKTTAALGAGTVASRYGRLATILGTAAAAPQIANGAALKPALLGGTPAHTGGFTSWPIHAQAEEQALLEVLRSGRWFRGNGRKVAEFEEAYAKSIGSKHCVATANGTSALLGSLGAMEVGPGDEVILPPYTFIATLNVITLNHALPVFVDSDPESFQMDARKLESAVTDRTALIMPVHLGGNVADLDMIMEVSQRRKIPVLEDACQAPLAEWRGRRVGTFGSAGCFSFQASKNLNAGEGGAVVTDNQELAEKIYAFHNNNRGRRVTGYNFSYNGTRGTNLRLTEWQGAMLLAQMTRLEQQSRVREENAQYLTSQLRDIPGILPEKMYAGCTRNAYHLYMFRFDSARFGGGLTRAGFMKALSAEGVPVSGGYTPLNKEAFLATLLASKAYRRIYPANVLAQWEERNRCPANDQLCAQAVWLTHQMLLGPRKDMDDIVTAIRKIHAHAGQLMQA